ncbi:hypothetical protein ACQPXB_24615 [Amycolatopsis sp. CA-161197]|uniref:hypothetical protein n=1 Tax=Amycolatopsis sp. CA-161197 TaxID=3239922 RepID=UPI003D90BA90
MGRTADGVGDLAAGQHGVVHLVRGDDRHRLDAGRPVAFVGAADQVTEAAELRDEVGGGGQQ